MINGYIHNFLKELPSLRQMAIPYGDGLIEELPGDNSKDYSGYANDVLLLVQCYRTPVLKVKNRLICGPVDDRTFEYGLRNVLLQEAPNLDLPWDQKKPIAYWRGNGNMQSTHNPRAKFVERLFINKNANVRFVRTPSTEKFNWETPYFDPRFGDTYQPVPLTEFIEHKYVFILDNFIISSGFQVVFGLGSVPILICHPDTKFWFRDRLIPMVNFVPVDVTLHDLEEKILWLLDHDDEARQIAKNARALSDEIFSPQYQRQYLINAIHHG